MPAVPPSAGRSIRRSTPPLATVAVVIDHGKHKNQSTAAGSDFFPTTTGKRPNSQELGRLRIFIAIDNVLQEQNRQHAHDKAITEYRHHQRG